MEGTASPTAASNEFYEYSPINGAGVFDGIKGDNLRFQTTANGFVVITLGQSQLIKKVRVYTDEVTIHYILQKMVFNETIICHFNYLCFSHFNRIISLML